MTAPLLPEVAIIYRAKDGRLLVTPAEWIPAAACEAHYKLCVLSAGYGVTVVDLTIPSHRVAMALKGASDDGD